MNDISVLPYQPTSSPTERRAQANALAASLPHALWRGDSLGSPRSANRATGYSKLDQELPGGGWPASVLTELLWPQPGAGEIRLLAPLLAALSTAGETIVLLAPPHRLFAPALAQMNIDIKRLLLIQSEQPGDRLWAAEQVLKSASFGALLCWLPQVKPDHLRRLQLAAGSGEGLAFVFRPASAQAESSPAPLRLLCRAASAGQISVEIIKRRGPLAVAPIVLQTQLPVVIERPLKRRQARPATPSPVEFPHVVDRPAFTEITAGSRVPSLA